MAQVFRQFDLRDNSFTDFDFSNKFGPLKCLAVNEIRPEMLALGVINAMVPIYDRRNMKEPIIQLLPGFWNILLIKRVLHLAHLSTSSESRFLATSLSFNQRGDELLVNMGSDNIYIFDVTHPGKHNHRDFFSAIKRQVIQWLIETALTKYSFTFIEAGMPFVSLFFFFIWPRFFCLIFSRRPSSSSHYLKGNHTHAIKEKILTFTHISFCQE